MILRLQDVCKSYRRAGGNQVALADVCLEVDRGEMVGVFGESGAGKTALLRVAAGLQKPDAGVISYNGERLESISAAERGRIRRREIACVWGSRAEDDRLRVLTHVMLPLLVDRRSHGTAERLARDALLACEADPYTDLELHELSDGQRQRVEIARAVVIEPRLLLADGPTSHLPLIEQETVMQLLADLAGRAGVAVLVTSGDAETLMRSNRILYMREGRLGKAESKAQGATIYPLIREPQPEVDAPARRSV